MLQCKDWRTRTGDSDLGESEPILLEQKQQSTDTLFFFFFFFFSDTLLTHLMQESTAQSSKLSQVMRLIVNGTKTYQNQLFTKIEFKNILPFSH